MSKVKLIKELVSKTPMCLGLQLARIPFSLRLGSSYDSYKKLGQCADGIKEDTIFRSMLSIVKHAEKNIPFYKWYYDQHGFSSCCLSGFKDLTKIPILRKETLQSKDFLERIDNTQKGIITNTGGTTGQPLKVMLDSSAYSREWAHMHLIWEQLGYKTSSLKLTVRGINLEGTALQYNAIHNEVQVNAYCEFSDLIDPLYKLLSKHKVEFIHGYPSGIYELLKQLSNHTPELLELLKKNIRGVFLGSEYPAPHFRNFIERILGVPTVSWYGHTEMAVLAGERFTPFVYYPFQSYGYTEASLIKGKYHLIGTTIYNKVSPLIRYDTGDIIEPLTYQNGILESFKVSEGRTGEFVTDGTGRKISLTALIFGRHHKIFEVAEFIQVQQIKDGELTVFVTTQNESLDCIRLFDSSGMNMNIDFVIVKQPFKTKAGKVNLLVKGKK